MKIFVKILFVLAVIFIVGCTDRTAVTSVENTHTHGKFANEIQVSMCDSFMNIQHCNLGNTTLQLQNSSTQLAVAGFSVSDSDGVKSTFGTVTTWSQSRTFYPQSSGNNILHYYSKSGGTINSQLTISQISSTDTFQIYPDFSSSSGTNGKYTVKVYLDTALAGSQTGIDNLTRTNWWIDVYDGAGKRTNTSLGAAEWVLTSTSNSTFILPNTTACIGNKIVITAETLPGSYTNTFQEIGFTSNIDSLHITSETITP